MKIAEQIVVPTASVTEHVFSIEERITEIVAPALTFHSLSLVDVHHSRQRYRHQIRLTLYHENGVSSSDLSAVHAIVYPRLTVLLDDQDIALELSSPGIDYVFKNDCDYTVFNGQQVRLLSKSDNLWHNGTLIGHDEQGILIEDATGTVGRYADHDALKVTLNSTAQKEMK